MRTTTGLQFSMKQARNQNDTDRISGYDVHSTKNGMLLTTELHSLFGDFELTFTETHKPGIYTTPHLRRVWR